MGQKSPMMKQSKEPKTLKTASSAKTDDGDAAKEAARLRTRIDHLAIGDRAVYDENSMPDIK